MGHVKDQWTVRNPALRDDPNAKPKRVRGPRWGKGRRWLAVWIDPGTYREVSRAFDTKDEAAAHISDQDSAIRTGSYISPAKARATVGTYLDRWLASRSVDPSTDRWYKGVAKRVRDRWGDVPVRSVSRAAVVEWVSELTTADGLSPSRVTGHIFVLSSTLQHAVHDGAMVRNVAAKIHGPTVTTTRPQPIPIPRLARIVHHLDAEGVEMGTFALTLGFTGARWGEIAGARVGDLHQDTRRIEIQQSRPAHAAKVKDGTKNHKHRDVPVPPSLLPRLAALTVGPDRHPRDGAELLFAGPRSDRLHYSTWRRTWERCCLAAVTDEIAEDLISRGATPDQAREQATVRAQAAQLPHTHDLRHTAASLAIAQGADIKVIQRMLGHASAKMTLDVYGHLMGDGLDTVAEKLGLVLDQIIPSTPGATDSGSDGPDSPGRHLRVV